MPERIHTIITGSGTYLPKRKIENSHFLSSSFLDSNGQRIEKSNEEIIQKFKEITTIAERRYVTDDLMTSDIATLAGIAALDRASVDKETLDYVIVAHNFGDVYPDKNRIDIVPSLAARVKRKMEIENPDTVAYDLPFGCPGWLQGVIQADYYIRSGDAKRVLVIGAETLSRIIDPHDRDSMLYADGAGAVLLEAEIAAEPRGILTHKTRSDTLLHSNMLFMGPSYNGNHQPTDDLYLKMYGRKLYQYALEFVPSAIKACLDKSGKDPQDVKKILIHQANGKMDDAIVKRFYRLYDIKEIPEGVLPMIISWTGNSSVATVPTLYDLIVRGSLPGHEIESGDVLVFASVGAGMNINAMIYQV
jgi:3-oxoacyl-[acyl-carrier-protein] synthase-3